MTEVRNRISERTNRAKIALQLRRSVTPAWVYLAGILVAIACAVYIAVNLPGGGGLTSSRTVSFVVADASGVVPHRAEVRFKGIPAGTVTAVRPHAGGALVTAKLYERFGALYHDGRAALRPNTPLQDVYVDVLDRGTKATGAVTASSPLSDARTTSSVNVADVLQAFDGDVRGNLRVLLGQFGSGLDDRGAELRTALVQLAPFLENAGRLTRQLAVRETRTRRLVHNATALTAELGERQAEIRTLLATGSDVVGTLRRSSPELSATLAALPPAMRRLDTSLTTVGGVLPDVDGALAAVRPVADVLDRSLGTLRRLSTASGPAVRALRTPVKRLDPLATTLPGTAADLQRATTQLRTRTGTLDHVTKVVASCGFVIQRFFHWTQSVFSMGDAHGEAPRGDAALGIDTPGILKGPRVSESPTCAGGVGRHGQQQLVKP